MPEKKISSVLKKKGISIFKFSQLNWNYEYQFFDTETCEVSNILIILLAGTRRVSKKGREGALQDWKELSLCTHTQYLTGRRSCTRVKAHKFPSTLNTHTSDILPCLQNKIGFLFPLLRAWSCLRKCEKRSQSWMSQRNMLQPAVRHLVKVSSPTLLCPFIARNFSSFTNLYFSIEKFPANFLFVRVLN
jgi:hypothetical protein